MADEPNLQFSEREALLFHSEGRPGKIEIVASKPMATQRDLALAYSPGVAVPVRAIAEDPATAYDYTAKGNLVAVISNGTAILGLGNLGALASKPVMEGKAVLFKRFADVDSIDLEVDTEDVDAFVNCVALLEPSFGGINLEDIKAPECFIIEQALRERMNIPVFHDDQHGTAIITAAGLINACLLTGRRLDEVKIVVNGAGAAAIACTELAKAMGVRHDNVIMCDRQGVIYQGREEGMDQWKSAHAAATRRRTLTEALHGADVFLGLSAAGALKPEMVTDMAPAPIIFAMANPEPEIRPEAATAARPDAIVATGRSDYPNQVNNVLGFPYVFRGALDVRASAINDRMKIAAAHAIADLARQRVPEEVAVAYGVRHSFGPEYIIPAPFDPRLIEVVPMAVARAAMDSGVATRPIVDMDAYRQRLRERLNPTTSVLTLAYEGARARPKRVLFAEGEEEVVLRAAIAFKEGGLGTPVLVGRDDVYDRLRALGVERPEEYELHNSRHSPLVPSMVEFLYGRLQRRGYLRRDVDRMINQDRNAFGAVLLQMGHADAMITGVTRTYAHTMRDLRRVIDPAAGRVPFGIHLLVGRTHTVFIADTTVNERPTAEELADIAEQTAQVARRMGHEPRVAFLSYSTFGNPEGKWLENIRAAVGVLDGREVAFEYEGEMAPDVALNPRQLANYPFARLSGPANVLIMPGLQSANISAKLLRELGGDAMIGPMLVGMEKPVQIAPMTSTASELVTLAVLAAGDRKIAAMRRPSMTAACAALLAGSAPAAEPAGRSGLVRVRLDTSAGPITLALDARRAPMTTANFMAYVDDGRFDGTVFYRAARSKTRPGSGFVQGGVRTDLRRALPPIDLEPTSRTGLRHLDATVSMAHGTFDASATGNFVLTVGPSPQMDARAGFTGYAAFGRVTAGMDAVRRILAQPSGGGSGVMRGQMILRPVRIVRATRLDGTPKPSGRPKVWLILRGQDR